MTKVFVTYQCCIFFFKVPFDSGKSCYGESVAEKNSFTIVLFRNSKLRDSVKITEPEETTNPTSGVDFF